MKKLLFFVFVFISCNVLMSEDIFIVFYQNPDNEGVTHYEIYKADSNDTLSLNLVSIGSVPHVFGDDTVYVPTTFDSSYIKVGVQAVNPFGASNIVESDVYDRTILPPSDPLLAFPAVIPRD